MANLFTTYYDSDLSSYESNLPEEADNAEFCDESTETNIHNAIKDTQDRINETPSVALGQLKFETQYDIEDEALDIKISPDRSAFAVALSNGVIRLFYINKVANSSPVIRLKAPGEHLPCTSLIFTSSSKNSRSKHFQHLLAVYSSGFIRLWCCFGTPEKSSLVFELCEFSVPCDFNNVKERVKEPNEILCISLSTDDSRFVTGGTDTVIKVYDFLNKIWLTDLKPSARTGSKRICNYHTSRITALKYHPRGATDQVYSHIFVSASWDNSIQIWDDRTNGSLWQYYGPHVVGSDGLDIDGNRNLILTSSWKRSSAIVQMWKFADFSLNSIAHGKKRTALNYSSPVDEVVLENVNTKSQGYVAKFGGGGQYIFFAGANDNILRVLETEKMMTLAGVNNLPNAVYSLDSCFDRVDKNRCVVIFTNTANVYVSSLSMRSPNSGGD